MEEITRSPRADELVPERGLGRTVVAVLTAALLLAAGLFAGPARAAINSVTITGGTGTATVGGTLYAKQGQTVSISVVTDALPCKVVLSGAHTATLTAPSSSTPTTKTWNFGSFTVASGDGTRTVTATSTKLNANGNQCNSSDATQSSSYVADNTAPTIAPTITSGAPNGAGWSNQDVNITWTGSDTGSGFQAVTTGPAADRNPNPNTSTQSTETSGTPLTSSGVDRVGNSGTRSQTVKLDKTKPNLTVPASFTAEATSAAGAVVTYSTTAGDTLSGPSSITPTCSRASGSTFPLGPTTVSCSATDVAGNTETKSFTVTVSDTTGPVFSNIPSIAAAEGDTRGGKIVTWTDPTATDAVSGSRPVTCTPSSGSLFPVGETTVTCTATDAAGNRTNAPFSVIVSDTSGPVLFIPESFRVEATGPDGAVVEYEASADDVVDGVRPVSCTPASGSQFALGGPHRVDCSAADSRNIETTGSFGVTVVDTTPPAFGDAPTVGPFEATGPGGAAISYSAPIASDAVSGPITGSCLPASETTLAIGTHTVTCNASDGAGNPATALEFPVTVQDTTPPVLTGAPEDQTIEATGPDGAVANFTTPTADDAVDGPRTVSCNRTSGDTFPIDTTLVTCSTTDSRGHSAEVRFSITVADRTGPTLTVPANITVNATSAAGAEVHFTVTAADAVDPAVTPSCTPSSPSVFAAGTTTTVTCDAADASGNAARTETFTVTVNPWLTYAFGGFQRPVDPQPTLNRAKAGSAIPVKFSLGRNHGLDIWAMNPNGTTGPQSGSMTCGSTATVDAIESTVTAGSSSLQYDSVSNTYTYVWKTDSRWASSCRQLVLRFADGTTQRANFNFVK